MFGSEIWLSFVINDGISVDEYGTEWYEDEVGTWWYREQGAEDWAEYNE